VKQNSTAARLSKTTQAGGGNSNRSWVVRVRTQAGGELELEAVARGAELDREPKRQGRRAAAANSIQMSGGELDPLPSMEEPGNF
jgi:hypothetical protein